MNINSHFGLNTVSQQVSQPYDKIQKSAKDGFEAMKHSDVSVAPAKQQRAARIDKIEISHGSHAEERGTSELLKLRDQLVSDLQNDASAEKVYALKTKIALGQYNVDARELANALLDN